jgi:predicted RNase H-like nuclease (RuvC/YqgF family)
MKYLIMMTIGGIMGILIFNYVYISNGITDSHVKELQVKNDSLMMANERVDSINSYYKDLIEKKDSQISQLNQIDLSLDSKIKETSNKINNLKNKYEKANNHASNFGSNEIASYFANL